MHSYDHLLRWVEIFIEVISCCPPSNGLLHSTDDSSILARTEAVARVVQSATNFLQNFITGSMVDHATGENNDYRISSKIRHENNNIALALPNF